jgi:hypothetical protein
MLWLYTSSYARQSVSAFRSLTFFPCPDLSLPVYLAVRESLIPRFIRYSELSLPMRSIVGEQHSLAYLALFPWLD